MNKKRLSVVMAGAMLATSVAPVLAATEKSEMSAAELGLLIQKVRNKLNSATFANETAEDREINGDLAGRSIYEVKINGKVLPLDVTSSQDDFQKHLGSLKVGTKVEIWTRGYKEVKEGETTKYYAREAKNAEEYTVEDFTTGRGSTASKIQAAIRKITALNQTVVTVKTLQNDEKIIEIEFKKTGSGAEATVIGSGKNEKAKLTIAEGDVKYDFTHYIDNTTGDKLTVKTDTANTDIRDFARVTSSYTDIAEVEKVEEITITPGGYDLALEDLYDGLMLTTKGHDFFTMLKEAKSINRPYVVTGNKGNIASNATKSEVAGAIGKDAKGKYVFTVTLPEFKLEGTDDRKLAKEVYTITAKNEKDAERVAYWMLKPLARVDILAGDNRYETAVKISKEYAELTGLNVSNFGDNADRKGVNIVLVNGNALVDGLSAAPLAATLTNKVGDATHKAPVLLTEADALPKATRAYLKEIIANVKVGNLNDVTVHLVGGEAVLNKSLERELRSLGFKTARYGGDNREETSLKVSEKIEALTGKDEKFVVGAEGEADAMSIAAVAATNRTPIIVAKKGGISEDAVYELKGSNVAVIGGETVVSKSEMDEIKASAAGAIRIFGSNRQATNAEIIKKYYAGNFITAQNVIVAKDGQKNKTELVDALAAANMAAEKKAPIVLATNKLSEDQIEALERHGNAAEALYQVGHGVARSVVKTIAESLELSNREY